jgi:hypothetical protein
MLTITHSEIFAGASPTLTQTTSSQFFVADGRKEAHMGHKWVRA